MAEALEGLTPISLRQAVEALPRRALQSLAKKQGVKANQKSDVLARQLFERFLTEAAAQAGGGSEDGDVPANTAGASAGPISTAQGGLSPVSEGARYLDGGEEEREGSAAAQHSVPAPSLVPEGLAFNPLFRQGASDQQEAAAGEAGRPAAQEQPAGQQEAAPPASTSRVKLLKRERSGGAAGGDGAAEQPRLAGSKRKASVEATEEAAPPAAKRQARKSGAAGPGAAPKPKPAGAGKPAPKPAMPAALKAANGPRPAPPANPSSAAASQGQAPPAKPVSVSAAPGSSKSVAERARLAEERHAARRAAALARAGKA